MTKGTIMKGKITTSLIGTIGSFVCSYFSFVLIYLGNIALVLRELFFLSSYLKWQLDFLLFDHFLRNS